MFDWLFDLAFIVGGLSVIPVTVGFIWFFGRAHERAEESNPPPALEWFITAGPEWRDITSCGPAATRPETFAYTMYKAGLSPRGVRELVDSSPDAVRQSAPRPHRMTDWRKRVRWSRWVSLVGSQELMVACLNAGMSYAETSRQVSTGELDPDGVRMLAALMYSPT